MSTPDSIYFLGTIVLTRGAGNRLEVSDGQQRLATVSMFIAAIRDHLATGDGSEKRAATKYEGKYLLEYNEVDGNFTQKIKLNDRDNDFFLRMILLPPDSQERGGVSQLYSSHERIMDAQRIIKKFVQNIISPFSAREKSRELYRWIDFVTKLAIVIIIEVPDDINAYTMFETLNDRGLRASQTDILKNFLFGMSRDRLGEIQTKWATMINVIESIGDDDLILSHIRHAWIAKNGPTVERELASKVKTTIGNMQQAIETVSYFEQTATYYVALMTSLEHPAWLRLGMTTRYHIYVITNILRIEQIRPLMLAIALNFNDDEIKKAFKLLLSLSVRFLVVGVSGSGGLEKNYGTIAKEISAHTITKAKQITDQMTVNVPVDKSFEEAFRTIRVTKIPLARYYLRAIESFRRGESNPEYGGVDDTIKYNLEHIMPESNSQGWGIAEEVAAAYHRRLGNMVLLNPSQNTSLGNGLYDAKKKILKESTLLTTQEAANYPRWLPDEITQRQQELAGSVSQIWSLGIR